MADQMTGPIIGLYTHFVIRAANRNSTSKIVDLRSLLPPMYKIVPLQFSPVIYPFPSGDHSISSKMRSYVLIILSLVFLIPLLYSFSEADISVDSLMPRTKRQCCDGCGYSGGGYGGYGGGYGGGQCCDACGQCGSGGYSGGAIVINAGGGGYGGYGDGYCYSCGGGGCYGCCG